MSGDVEDYLREHTDLPVDSAGEWTLDPVRQRQLLLDSGSWGKEQGFVKLAQAAYLSGSPHIRFFPRAKVMDIVFRSASCPQTPVCHWSGGKQSGWQQALALALLTLSGDYDLDWDWSWGEWRGKGSARDRLLEESTGSGPDEGSRFEIHIYSSRAYAPARGESGVQSAGGWGVFDLLRGDPWRSVRRHLEDLLSWMPMWVFWDDQIVNRLLLGPSRQPLVAGRISRKAEAFVYARPDQVGDLWLPETSSAAQSRGRCLGQDSSSVDAALTAAPTSIPGVRRGWAVLAKTNKSWSETVFICNGVQLPGENNLLDRPGVLAYVSGAGLDTDLSGLQIVHNQAFRDRLDALRPEVRWLDSLG